MEDACRQSEEAASSKLQPKPTSQNDIKIANRRDNEAKNSSDEQELSRISAVAPSSPTTTRSSSESANEPLLSETEETLFEEDEKLSGDTTEEKKSLFNSTEYKIAFSHFLVGHITRPWGHG